MHLIAKQFGKSFSHSHAQQLIKQEDYLKTGRFGLSCNSFQFGSNVAKKKRFSVSTLLKPRLRCGRRHFFATRVDLKKEAADFASRLYQSPPGGNLQKKQMDFWWQKHDPQQELFLEGHLWQARSQFLLRKINSSNIRSSVKSILDVDPGPQYALSCPAPKEASPKLSRTQFASPVWHSAWISSRCSPQKLFHWPSNEPL